MSSHAAGPGITGPALLDGHAAARMSAVVNRLASAEFAGRRIGTPGGRAAAVWLAAHLIELGAQVRLDEFAVAGAVKELSATPVLRWHNGFGDWSLVHRRDFAEHLASADLAAVHTGRLASSDNEDLRGAWVLADIFDVQQIRALAAVGAAGVLLPRGADEAGWMPKMIAGPAVCALPVLSVRTDLHRQMAAAIHNGQSSVSASAPLRTVDVTGINVHGIFLPGTPGGLSVLLTAHFDGVGDDPDLRFPASADNASGVSAVLEAAHQLHRSLPATVGLAVALLDGEEAGAYGSAHHAAQLAPGTLVINLDGAAQLHEAAAVEAGGPAHVLLSALDQAGRSVGVPLRAQAMPSDNRRYAAAGLPSVGVGMGMPGYQTPAETPDRVQDATLVAAASLLTATVAVLARAA